MVKFSFTFGANRWFSFTFETGTSPTPTSAPPPLVRYERGTTGPNNATIEKRRLAAHALIESFATDAARLSGTKLTPLPFGLPVLFGSNNKSLVSPAQAAWTQSLRTADRSHIDPTLRSLALAESTDSTTNAKGHAKLDASVAVTRTTVNHGQKCHFLKIPAEIRILIYDLVLVSEDSIANAHKLLESDDSIDATDPDARIGGVDSRILQTCRTVLQEAAPILYGKNTFYFSNQDHIEAFKSSGLGQSCTHTTTPRPVPIIGINLISERHGRLALLRKVVLRLGPSDDFFPQLHRRDPKKARDSIWRGWWKLFDRKRMFNLDFPALETLTLDLSDWLLIADDMLRVDRFVKKFKSDHGLNHLLVKGMSNEKNLQDLKSGLVKPGGIFEVLP